MIDTHTHGVSRSGAIRQLVGEGVTHDNDDGAHRGDARTTW